MKKPLFLIVIITFSLLYFSCKGNIEKKTSGPANTDTIPVKTMPLEKKQVAGTFELAGKFTPEDEFVLSFKTGGPVEKIFVKEGDFVKKGQLLAVLDLTEIKSQVSQAELAYKKADRDFQRVSNLYADSAATLEQYQNAKTAQEVSKQVLNTANFNLDYSEIKAISDGYVLKVNVFEGQIVGAGMPIIRCDQTGNSSDWVFRADLSDREWSAIRINDKADIKTDAYPDGIIKGAVIRKSQNSDPLTGMFWADFKVAGPATHLANGLFGKAFVTTSDLKPLWAIPHDALLESNANTGFVFVTSDNLMAHKVKVTINAINDDSILVSSGLENASSLIVTGSAYLNDNMPIKLIN